MKLHDKLLRDLLINKSSNLIDPTNFYLCQGIRKKNQVAILNNKLMISRLKDCFRFLYLVLKKKSPFLVVIDSENPFLWLKLNFLSSKIPNFDVIKDKDFSPSKLIRKKGSYLIVIGLFLESKRTLFLKKETIKRFIPLVLFDSLESKSFPALFHFKIASSTFLTQDFISNLLIGVIIKTFFTNEK